MKKLFFSLIAAIIILLLFSNVQNDFKAYAQESQINSSTFIIGSFDVTRGGSGASFQYGNYFSQARSSLSAHFPNASLLSFPTLTIDNLSNIDILFITSVKNNVTAISPLSPDEQNALRQFVTGGGCAILLVDNDSFSGPVSDKANESIIDTFSMDIGGTIRNYVTNVSVLNPESSPITSRPFGTVTSFSQINPGGISSIMSPASILATNTIGAALVVIKKDGIQPGSGPVVVYSDANSFFNSSTTIGFPKNENLFLNTIQFCIDNVPNKNWTLMYYLAADNDIDTENALRKEYGYLKDASDNLNVNILGFWDGLNTEAGYFHFHEHIEDTVKKGELNTGDQKTLQDFVKWSVLNYPAAHYALVIDDHGHGLKGVAKDVHIPDDFSKGDGLTPIEISNALSGLPKLDILYMDNCLTATAEFAYQFRNLAYYYIASEAMGWSPYQHSLSIIGDLANGINPITNTTRPYDLAIDMAEVYRNSHKESEDNSITPGTISVIELSQMENVKNKTSIMAGKLKNQMVTLKSTLEGIRNAVQHYEENKDDQITNEDKLIDLYHFSTLVQEKISDPGIKSSAADVQSAIKSAVKFEDHWSGTPVNKVYYWDYQNSNGISIAFPSPETKECYYNLNWLDFASGTNWNCTGNSIGQFMPEEIIEWGPMLVEFNNQMNPNAPENFDPPDLVSPLHVSLNLASSSSELSNFPTRNMNDGNTSSSWSSIGHNEHLTSTEWAAVILPQKETIDRIRIYPRLGQSNLSLGFPKDFVIQYAFNGTNQYGRELTCDPTDARFTEANNWMPIVTRFGYLQPSNEPVDFNTGSKQAECVRVLGTELSQDDYGIRYMQLAEIELYNGTQKITPSQTAVSSTYSSWGQARLIDGKLESSWSSIGHTEHLISTEWATVILPQLTAVDEIRLFPRSGPYNLSLGFPKDFVIQYAYDRDGYTCDPADAKFSDANNWKPLATRFGYLQPTNDPVDFGFGRILAKCIRVLGTELSQDDYGIRYMQLAEIELYNTDQKLALSQAISLSNVPNWGAEMLIDGKTESNWSSAAHTEHLSSTEWAALILPQKQPIDRVLIYPRPGPSDISLGFPKDFVIQYAYDGTDAGGYQHTCDPSDIQFGNANNWMPMITRFSYPQPNNVVIDFIVGGKQAQCVRIWGTELSQDDYGWRYMQLAEIELYSGETNLMFTVIKP